MRVPAVVALTSSVALALLGGPARAAVLVPNGFQVRSLATGLTNPTAVAWAPGGRMFIATKAGLVYYEDPGDVAPTQLLDISSHVNSYSDRGLIDIAVDSDWANNHYLWLLYVYEPNPSTPTDTGPKTSRLTRVTVNPDNTVSAETTVLGTVTTAPCPTASNSVDCIPADVSHVVGTVRSAPDGTLWVGSGDGADFHVLDQNSFRAQDEQSFAGKIIHIDRSGHGLPDHPFCPAGAGQPDDLTRVCAKLYAKGFRNPFRFALPPSGPLIVADVGWNTTEELDFLRAGHNYGWPCYEGGAGTSYGSRTPQWSDDPKCSGAGGVYSLEGTSLAATPPDFDYPHDGVHASIIGGPLFPGGGGFPSQYTGKVFFGDYSRQPVWTYDPVTGLAQPFAQGISPGDLELAPDGDLVFVDEFTGEVGDIAYDPDPLAPVAVAGATPRGGDLPLDVQFDDSASHDPGGETLSYHWDFGDGTSANTASPMHTYSTLGTYVAWLTVKDTDGRTGSAPVVVAAGDHFPSAHIDAPGNGSAFVDTDTVDVAGSGSDPDAGPPPRLHWQVLQHDSGGAHQVGEWFNVTSFDWHPPSTGSDALYSIRLTATDSRGLSDTTSIDVTVKPAPPTVASALPGAGSLAAPAPEAGTSPSTASRRCGTSCTHRARRSHHHRRRHRGRRTKVR